MAKRYLHELIGERINVIAATNVAIVGLEGIIVDETRKTLVVETNASLRRLLKSTITIRLVRSGLCLDGKDLVRRPEERIKGI